MINREELENKIKLCVNAIAETITDENGHEFSHGYQFPLDDKGGITVSVSVFKP